MILVSLIFSSLQDVYSYFTSTKGRIGTVLAIAAELLMGTPHTDKDTNLDIHRISTTFSQPNKDLNAVVYASLLPHYQENNPVETLPQPSEKKEKENFLPQSVEELFVQNRLIVRAIGSDEIFEDIPHTGRYKLGSIQMEMEYMQSLEGLRNASATLLVAGMGVQMYKEIGYLYDGRHANIEHIYGIDSNSSTTVSGQLIAGSENQYLFHSLDELADAVRGPELFKQSRMNEINGHFFEKNLVGLTVRTANNFVEDNILNLKIRVIQKLINQKYHIPLPIYKYNENTGVLQPLSTIPRVIEKEIRISKTCSIMKNFMPVLQDFLLQ